MKSFEWLDRRVLIFCAMTSAVLSLLVSLLTVLVITSEANKTIRKNEINLCDGSNLLRGFAILATNDGKVVNPRPDSLAESILKIRDCEKSYDQARIVIVEDVVEREYLKALSERRRVAIRDGGRRLVPMP